MRIGISSGTAALHLALLALRRRDRATRSSPSRTPTSRRPSRSPTPGPPRCSSTSSRRPPNLDPDRVAGGAQRAHEGDPAGPPLRCGRRCRCDPCPRRPASRSLEDAAHAHGATLRGRPVGSLGRDGCVLVLPQQAARAPSGTAAPLTTSDDELDARIRQLRYMGQRGVKHEHLVLGYQERLDELQAAFLRVKLRHLDAQIEARRRIAVRYRSCSRGRRSDRRRTMPTGRHVYYMYTIQAPRREALRGLPRRAWHRDPAHLSQARSRPGRLPGTPVAGRLESRWLVRWCRRSCACRCSPS